jgi:hypothetical protein
LLIHYVNTQKGGETPTQLDYWQIQPSQNQTRKRGEETNCTHERVVEVEEQEEREKTG